MTGDVLADLRASIDYGQGVERRGLGYVVAAEDGEGTYEATVSRLRSSGGEVRAELRILVNGRHLSAGSFNLSSLVARAQTTKLLTARAPQFPWGDILERLCVSVLAAERTGSPATMIGKRVSAAAEPRLLPPLLPAGHASVLFGPGGSGKSTLVAAAAVSIASGAEVIPGFRPLGPQPVGVFDWESCADDWSNLVAGIAEGAGIEAPRLPYLAMTRPLADDVERLAEVVAEHAIRLAIVDSVGLALGIGREAGDPADAVLRMHQALRHLGVTSVLVDHVAGADIAAGTTAASRPYGSVYKLNAARDVWELRREHEPRDGAAEVLLIHAKANLSGLHPPIGLRIVHYGGLVRFERGDVTAPELESRLTAAERIRRVLSRGARTVKEISEETGIADNAIRATLGRHRDRFIDLGGKRWGLTSLP
jgi:hypothetical protein